MSDFLQLAAALLAACCTAALVLALLKLHGLLVGQVRGMVSFEAPGRRFSLPRLLRKTLVGLLAVQNERWFPPPRLARLEAMLRKAGRPHELRAAEIVACMQLSALVSLCLGIALSLCLGLGVVTPFLSLLFGAAYPLLWLRDKVKTRHHAITRALPYDMDLLTLSVEAGLDFAAALGKVVAMGRKGALAEELAITLKELKLGKTREEALRTLSQRVDLPALSSLVHALIQADKMGTSLGKVLRILGTQMRLERTQRAEKLANEAPIKLLIPLIGFIFPTIFLMLFGPIAYQVFFGGSF
jgi:tight adherence protein C